MNIILYHDVASFFKKLLIKMETKVICVKTFGNTDEIFFIRGGIYNANIGIEYNEVRGELNYIYCFHKEEFKEHFIELVKYRNNILNEVLN